MDTHSESCEPPPCDPQPPGKIRKALKLFSKRKPGSIFSVRGKCEGGPKSPPSKSKTLDGLMETVAPEAETESLDFDQEESQKEDDPMEESTSKEDTLETTPTRLSISSITSAKSLSFLNMLRRGRKGGGGERYAQTESQRSGRQRKGLKCLFGSVRWHGKDKEGVDEVEPGPPLLASRSNSVEIIKENLTLTPRPAPRSPDVSEREQEPPASQDEPISSEDTAKVSNTAKPPTNDRLSTLLGDISSILSFDPLTSGGDIVADVEAEWVKVSSRVEGTEDTGKKDKAAAISTKHKPTVSPTSGLSSTSSSAIIAQPLPSSITSPKPMPSSTKNVTLYPASTPSPSILVKSTPPPTIADTHSSTAKPHPSSPVHKSSPIPLTKPTPIPSTEPMQSLAVTPTATISTQPALIPISTPTLEHTPSPPVAPAPAHVSETSISPTVKLALELTASSEVRTETTPIPTPTAITKPTPTAAPAPSSKPIPLPKYPPFSTSTKPTPSAPVARPKIVTTFGLSTSRNTAPIAKLESKQPVPVSATTKSPTSEDPPHAAKPAAPSHVPSALKMQIMIAKPTHESATSAKPTNKPEPSVTLESPTLQATAFTGLRGEKEQDDMARQRSLEKTGVHSLPPKMEAQNDGQDHLPFSSYKPEKKSSAAKHTALSKIPVSGGGRPKQLHKDGQSSGEEAHWNLPTPVHEEERPISLSRESSSSKEPLSDFSTGSVAVTPTLSHSHEDILDFCPIFRPTGLPRESKIPMKPGSTATYHSLQGKTEAARSKIPVSKMPVRRTSNKPLSTATATSTQK